MVRRKQQQEDLGEGFGSQVADDKEADEIRALLNKKAGGTVAYDLSESNPSNVVDWISTGSRWLDSIICDGKMAGIPVGKVTELAGIESSGKSFMAAQIAKNAVKKGIRVIYFDSESAVDSAFWHKIGISTKEIVYVQAESIETVCEHMDLLMTNSPNKRFLFVLDSLAQTATEENLAREGFDPTTSMAYGARVTSVAFKKLTIPLARTQSTFLIVNQLKTNLNNGPHGLDPFFTPGGKSVAYACSLRIWLTASRGKDDLIRVNDDKKSDILGTKIKATIKKSRFGSMGRQAEFDILWAGPKVSIQDEDSWLDAIKPSEFLKQSGAWYTIIMGDGSEVKFQSTGWREKLKDEVFKNRVIEIMDDLLIENHKPGYSELE